MNNQKEFILKQGLVAGLIGIILIPISWYFEIVNEGWWMAISYLLPVVFITYRLYGYRSLMPGKAMGFDLAFRLGFFAMMMGALLSSVFGFIYLNYIKPENMEMLIEIQRQQAFDQGILNEKQIELQIDWSRKMMRNIWMALGFSMLPMAFINAISALVLAIILRRGPAETKEVTE